MSKNISVWISDQGNAELSELLENNKKGYSDEFLTNDRIMRFRQVLMKTTMSGLGGELLLLGLMVLKNNMKDMGGKHKVDMSEYYEQLLYNVAVCRKLLEQATEGGQIEHSDIDALMNRMFRGDSEKAE